MNITINEKEYTVAENAVLLDVLTTIGAETLNGTAVAINEAIISRSAWDTKQLHENDSVLLIQATQGG